MAVPKQRHNSARQGRRRQNHGLKLPRPIVDESGNMVFPHRVSPVTGLYRGRDYSRSEKK
ncbi:MAG: 50S ribosomal protein L32 [Candidatus Moranbacteria bacterium]|nr:50S ribosomal protein L32 [Candidatus Moranbacteria bacterium]